MPRALALAAVVLVAGGSTAASAGGDDGLIVFSSNRSQWRADHVFLYAPGGQLRALAEGTAAALSPDGTQIAFLRGRPGNERELVVMRADGSGQRTVVRQPEGAQPISPSHGLAWSPDGTRIAFLELGPTILVADVATGAVARIEQASSPSWSPDGGRLVFLDSSAGPALGVADAAGGERRRLLELPQGGGGAPQWSPTGRWIAYAAGLDLQLVAPDGSGARPLTRDRDSEWVPSW